MTATGDRLLIDSITEPGWYEMTDVEYHADPVKGGSLSSTGARTLATKTPAHFDWERRHGRPDKAELDFGRVAHARVLGKGSDIVVVLGTGKDKNAWNTNESKANVARARATGKNPIKLRDNQAINEMADRLREHPIAGPLLARPGRHEQVGVWRDPETGVWCRLMADFLPDVGAADRLLVIDYKGLALDTAIPTPTGWTTMRALQSGDRVLGSDGRSCAVTAKSEVRWRTCYRIRFDDGSTVICDDEHLWATHTTAPGNRGQVFAVRTTDEIRRTMRKYGQCQHRVPVAAALDLPPAELLIDPYVLGCWLGDGTRTSGRISKPDGELFDLIAARGYRIGPPPPSTVRRGCPTRTIYGLATQLRELDLLGHKLIPDVYLRASVTQRRDLLRGLMDTDGSWNSTRGQAVFTTIDKAFAEQVRELALSLGQRAIVSGYAAHGYGKDLTAYRVTFRPLAGLNPFLLSRKAHQVQARSGRRSRQRIVTAVEPVPVVPTQCITVDSPDSTYLCTEAMIPTHNTTLDASPAGFAKSMANFGYDQQGDFYATGVHALDPRGELPQFVLIAQEKTPPYLVTVNYLDEQALARGRHRNRSALELYAACAASGLWPGYPVGPVELRLPAWAARQFEAEREDLTDETYGGTAA